MSYSKFLDASRDLDDWRSKNNLPSQSFDETFADLRTIWIEDKKYAALISFINENWDSGNGDDFFNPLSEHLVTHKEPRYYKKLWKGVLRYRLSSLWNYTDYIFQEYPKITLHEIETTNIENFNQFSSTESYLRRFCWLRKYTLKGIQTYKEGLLELNDLDEIDSAEKLYEAVYNLNKPISKKTADKRKIDESLFWELIEVNRSNAEDKIDFIEKISHKLEEFKPTEIRRFERFFLTKYQELHRWEIWALAYIVRRGCGDDAFDYFKAWVISKGEKAFNDINSLNISALKQYFDEDPQLEEMLSLAEDAYENKTGDFMPPIRMKKQKLLGEQWDEENLDQEFPEIWKLFKHKKNTFSDL